MAYQRNADRKDRTRKCTLYVARSKAKRMVWSPAKEMFVAVIRVGVGPGVNIELKRSVMKVAMTAEG